MRLHEAIRNLNIGLDTAAEFLASKGMPLEDRNLNVRLRDMQCSLLYREFGYKPQAKQLRSSVAHEKPEVQAVLNEIHQRHSKPTKKQATIETKADKKAKRKLLIEQELKQIVGQKVKIKVKGFASKVLYTKGYGNLFIEGRVHLSDVYYNGIELSTYCAEGLLKTCSGKKEFTVLEPRVEVTGSKNGTYARLRYEVCPEQSWQKQFDKLVPGKEIKGYVIDVTREQYIVKCSLHEGYFIWGAVDKNEYFDDYEITNAITVCIKHIGSNLFAPIIFQSNLKEKEPFLEDVNWETETNNDDKKDSSNDDNDFIRWRESQKKELDLQRELLQAAPYNYNKEDRAASNSTDGLKTHEAEYNSQDEIKSIRCEATFFDDYEVKGHSLDEYLYKNESISFNKYLSISGSIVLRYKLLIALADLVSAYHNANLVLGNMNPANFEVVSDEPIVVRMQDDSSASYKTNMMHMQESFPYIAPEVRHHLSPITPMSECYSFASFVYQMLTGKEFSLTNDYSDTIYVASSVRDILFQSLSNDPMQRPKMNYWRDSLRNGLDELMYCSQCNQWHVLNSSGTCTTCKNKSNLLICLKVGYYGDAEIYNYRQNTIEKKPTLIGKAKGNVIITENTSKILYGYHFGVLSKKDQPIAVITITQCNSNKDITLHIIPMSGTAFTLLDDNYTPIDEAFEDATDIDINGEELYSTMFLVESETFNNKILKLCHI